MEYVDKIYEIVQHDCQGIDAINGAYICKLVGEEGLKALVESRLVETCGVVHGNQLYVLLDRKENDEPTGEVLL